MVIAKLENEAWDKGKQSLNAPSLSRSGHGSFSNRSLPGEDSAGGAAEENSGSFPRQKGEERSQACLCFFFFHFSSDGLAGAE